MTFLPTGPQTGGCLCGAMRYELASPPTLIYTCHCTDCQRLTASAFSMAMAVAGGAFQWRSGEPRPIRRTTAAGTISTRWVCPECGVLMCGGSKPGGGGNDPLRLVRAGTLDDTSWVRPTVHFWTRSAQPWFIFPDGDTVFATQPDDVRSFLAQGGKA